MARVRIYGVIGLVLVAAVTSGCSGTAGPGSGTASRSTSGQAAPPTESNPPGDIPDNQAYVGFRPAGRGFLVKVPEGWSRAVKGNTTIFTDKLNQVRVDEVRAPAAPTTASVTRDVVPKLRREVSRFGEANVTQVSRHAGKVVRLEYRGDSATDPVTGKVIRDAFERYAFYRRGHEVDITLSGPVNADNIDPWRVISDSFTWQ
ncbi:hypothetical protein D0Z67_01360 [Streptomyces seoulensis]|uniref:Lipoprotein n=1 Tax=Streptomyces seoulensis TaxID=73044 RepID=A0A4P6TQY3_STRSO|nr:hypothetical protein [Streptomyces seoulensis]QBJ89097.1 hypothetical protein D0Z67_01360 [Streptomyces seoulensis]